MSEAVRLKHIWCAGCKEIQPALYEEMPGRDVSGKFKRPTDIICSECRLIIATLYDEPKS